MRLNFNCSNFEDTSIYFKERAIQFYWENYQLKSIQDYKECAIAIFEKNLKEYISIYVYEQHRNKGVYSEMMRKFSDKTIITSNDCNIEKFLKKKGFKYIIASGFTDYIEYQYINDFYNIECSKRSKVPFMNHIDEGLAILNWIGASLEAKKAYCLHPIFQSDETFSLFGKKDLRDKSIFGINSNVITNAVEYRNIANFYLSKDNISNINDIKISPLKDVNDMLIADKIQNRKDFELYHLDSHPRSKELLQYFKNWLERLEISEEIYQDYKKRLILNI